MKKTTKKLSLGMKIASILACLALVSVGFASWWIVRMPDQQLEQGSFTVYGVETKEIAYPEDKIKFVTEAGAEDNAVIAFGKPTETVNNPWLGFTEDMLVEDLYTVLQFDVTLTSSAQNDNINSYMENVKVDLTVPSTYTQKIVNTSAKTGYVAAPKLYYRYGTSGTWLEGDQDVEGDVYTITIPAPTGKSQTVQVKFEFDWSYYYGDDDASIALVTENPYTYFNGLSNGYTTRRADAANGILTNINQVGNAQFGVKIYSTPAGAPANG